MQKIQNVILNWDKRGFQTEEVSVMRPLIKMIHVFLSPVLLLCYISVIVQITAVTSWRFYKTTTKVLPKCFAKMPCLPYWEVYHDVAYSKGLCFVSHFLSLAFVTFTSWSICKSFWFFFHLFNWFYRSIQVSLNIIITTWLAIKYPIEMFNL